MSHLVIVLVCFVVVFQLARRDHSFETSVRLLLKATDIIKAYVASYFEETSLQIDEAKVICRQGGVKLGEEVNHVREVDVKRLYLLLYSIALRTISLSSLSVFQNIQDGFVFFMIWAEL